MTKNEALKSLDPRAASKLSMALTEMENQNVPYFISEARRTLQTQCLYFLQGLPQVSQSELEWACKEAGIRPPGTQRITWTLKSNHLSGMAVDIVPLKDGKPDWNNQDMSIVEIMKKYGFAWGGDWAVKVDKPHFELAV
jgi:hypothetical protein